MSWNKLKFKWPELYNTLMDWIVVTRSLISYKIPLLSTLRAPKPGTPISTSRLKCSSLLKIDSSDAERLVFVLCIREIQDISSRPRNLLSWHVFSFYSVSAGKLYFDTVNYIVTVSFCTFSDLIFIRFSYYVTLCTLTINEGTLPYIKNVSH